jgi:cytochrome b561
VLVHEWVRLTILAAMVFRALWRWRHPPPPLPPAPALLEVGLARFTHLLLYALLFIMPLAGYLNVAVAGHAVDLFGVLTIPQLLPENDRLSRWAIAVHLAGQYPLYLFVALHVAGALFHGAIRRDGILKRMLPIRKSS